MHILSKTSCTTYIRSGELSAKVDEIAAKGTGIRTMAAPQLDDLLREDFAQKFPYNKSWEDGKDDPWLVFHTSGTTGRSLRALSLRSLLLITFFIQATRSQSPIRIG